MKFGGNTEWISKGVPGGLARGYHNTNSEGPMHCGRLRSAPFEGQVTKHVTSDASSWSCAVGALPNSNTHCCHACKVKERNLRVQIAAQPHVYNMHTHSCQRTHTQITAKVINGNGQWDHCTDFLYLPKRASTVLSAFQHLTFSFLWVRFLIPFATS